MMTALTLAALLVTAQGPDRPAAVSVQKPDEVANEARHLKNIRQVTFEFARAGEGYFRPDGKAVIFQASKRADGDYQIYTLDLAPDALPRLVSTGRGKCTCSY